MKTLTELVNKINAPVFSKVYLRETGDGKYTIYYEGSDAYLAFTKGNIITIPLKDKNVNGFEIQEIYVPSKDRNNYYARTLLDACIEIAIGDNSNIYLCASSMDNMTDQEKLVKFYIGMGFEPIPQEELEDNQNPNIFFVYYME
jgi:hypothetical protein